MSGRVLLAIHCPEDRLYAHRHQIQAMYAGRFPDMAFVISPRCALDPAVHNVVAGWSPGAPGSSRACDCNDPERPTPHACDEHHRHPRIAAVAAASRPYDAVLFVDTDVILAPSLTPATLLGRLAEGRHRAMLGPIVEADAREWVWVDHESGGPSLARLDGYLDPDRLWRHWCLYRGRWPTPRPAALPVLSAWSDMLLIESRLLRRLARDLVAFQSVFHEIAVPTVLLHATPCLATARAAVWWGADRDRPLGELLATLDGSGAEVCHPIKFGTHGWALVERYRALEAGR